MGKSENFLKRAFGGAFSAGLRPEVIRYPKRGQFSYLGEGWASPGLRACSAVGSRLTVEGRRSRRRFCEASPHPNEASAFAAAGKIQKPLRRSCAARRSGKRLTRAELLLMVRRARPAPSHRLRCRCRAHRCARPCRILHAGRRWPRDRAERRLQLFDLELPILLHDGAA